MRLSFTVLSLSTLLLLNSCIALSIGTERKPSRIEAKGLGSAYAAIPGIEPFEGNIAQIGLFQDSARDGEWASVDIWPIGGVGVGFVGARIKLFIFEIGAGVFGYQPEPLAPKEECCTPPPDQEKKSEVKATPNSTTQN